MFKTHLYQKSDLAACLGPFFYCEVDYSTEHVQSLSYLLRWLNREDGFLGV
jgi:hypothetical protein